MRRRLLAILSALALFAGLSLAAAQPAQAVGLTYKTRTTTCTVPHTFFWDNNGNVNYAKTGTVTFKPMYTEYFDGSDYFEHPGWEPDPIGNYTDKGIWVQNNTDAFRINITDIKFEKRNQADTGWDLLAWANNPTYDSATALNYVPYYPNIPKYWGYNRAYSGGDLINMTPSLTWTTTWMGNGVDPGHHLFARFAWHDQQPKFIAVLYYHSNDGNVYGPLPCWIPLDGIDNP